MPSFCCDCSETGAAHESGGVQPTQGGPDAEAGVAQLPQATMMETPSEILVGWHQDENFSSEPSRLPEAKKPETAPKPTTFRKQFSFKSTHSGGTGTASEKATSIGLTSVHGGTAGGKGGARDLFKWWSDLGTNNLRDDERGILFSGDESGVVHPKSVNLRAGGRPNEIRTTQFTALTWLPKSLFHQFKRVANVYFLYIAILVVFGTLFSWSPKDWKSKIGPFVIVLLWTALKDLFEDTRRRHDDEAENSQRCMRYCHQTKSFKEAAWRDVLCGDILYIPEDGIFPADLFLLHAAGNAGSEAFISTVMLDGETSLKERRAPSACEALSQACKREGSSSWERAQCEGAGTCPWQQLEQELVRFVGKMHESGIAFEAGRPEAMLSEVRGNLRMSPKAEETDARKTPLNEGNFLARGCVLRTTPWILAVSVYVGRETKTRLNAANPSLKFSNMQTNLNRSIRGLLVVLFVLCITATVLSEALGKSKYMILIMFFRFCIVFYHAVPMSLYVMYEILKLVLGFQVNRDKQMMDPDTKEMALARTADLMEELGQIDFAFSDKTGTLTRNEMVFARCHVSGQDLGDFRVQGDGLDRARKILEEGKAENKTLFNDVFNFFTCLAVCHSVQVQQRSTEGGGLKYSGMSPDEVCLVEAANKVGISFESRKRKQGSSKSDVLVRGPSEHLQRFTQLYELAFSSDRKRMSVLAVLHDEIWCITKGADSVMEELLEEPLQAACKEDLARFSGQGLRTLVVASKKVDRTYFEQWEKDYKAAQNILDRSKDEQVAELEARIEKGLTFCGVTAVEDRLQDGVPETISAMKQMGIRVWVLTGDKTETAVDIARSCMLFTAATHVAFATKALDAQQADEVLQKAHEELMGKEEGGLVLDGQTLHFALEDTDCRRMIYQNGVVTRACVCSRLSPMQKLQLVKLVREQAPGTITLGVGDGANDVPMIHGAHVGVAIRGKEGTQAVQASDIAISQFRFLRPLLLCHGRRAYRRVALFLCYYLYKNMVLLVPDIIWMIEDRFQGRIAFPEYLTIGYNAFFTSWHILFVVGYDVDLKDEVANQSPELYRIGPERGLFNAQVFAKWMCFALLHGCITWFVPRHLVGGDAYDKEVPSLFWVSSATAFTTLNIIVCLKLILCAQNPFAPLMTILPTIGALLLYTFALYILGYTRLGNSFQPCMEDVPSRIVLNDDWDGNNALVATLVTPLLALTVDVLELAAAWVFCPSLLQRARRKSNSANGQQN